MSLHSRDFKLFSAFENKSSLDFLKIFNFLTIFWSKYSEANTLEGILWREYFIDTYLDLSRRWQSEG